jgi:site-specific DNA-adenine methylase
MNKKIVQKTTTLKSPIGGVSGKSKLSKEIVAQFPDYKHYVEVFG